MIQVRDELSERLSRERVRRELGRSRAPFAQWLGLLLLALVAVALLLTKLHLPAPWASTYRLQLAATDVTGVQPGSEVRIAGVAVGHVTAVTLRGGSPVLSLSIDPRYAPVYRDARVEIRPNTPLQDMYVDVINRGTRTAGAVPAGRELSAAQTGSPVQIGQVIDIFDAAVRPRVTATIDTLGTGLGEHGAQLRTALVELAPFLRAAQRLAHETAVRQTETARLVHDFARLTGELAGRTRALSGLVRDGASTLQRTASVARPLGALIDELPPTLRELPVSLATVDAAAGQLTPTARALLPVADALAPALRSLRALAPPADAALGALSRPLPGLTRLLGQAGPLGAQLARAFSALRPQAPELDRASAAVVPCELALQKFFQWTLSVSKLGGIHADMQRGIAVFGPQSVTGLLSPTLNGNLGALTVAPTCSGVAPGP